MILWPVINIAFTKIYFLKTKTRQSLKILKFIKKVCLVCGQKWTFFHTHRGFLYYPTGLVYVLQI